MEDDDRFCVRCGEPVEMTGASAGMPEKETETGRKAAGKMAAGSGAAGAKKAGDPVSGRVTAGRKAAARKAAGRAVSGRKVAGHGAAGYGEPGQASDHPKMDRGRMLLILVPALVILMIFGCLFFMLRKPSGSGDDTDRQENSLEAYQEGGSAPQGTASAGPSGPEVKETEAQSAQKTEDAGAEKEAEALARKQAGEEKAKKEAQEEQARKEAEEQARKEAEEEEARRLAEEEEKARREAEEKEAERGTDGTYILPDSASRYYTYDELSSLDDGTLQMAINEIYARHGRIFTTDSIREYFESKSWYHGTIDPAEFDGNEGSYFNDCEMRNRELMVRIRNERAQPEGPALEQQVQGQR